MSLLPTFRYTEAILCRIPDTLPPISRTPEKPKDKKGKKGTDVNGFGKENLEALNKVDLQKCRNEYDG